MEIKLPQGYSTFLSFVQTEAHDDFQHASVSVIYPKFEAFQSPERFKNINVKEMKINFTCPFLKGYLYPKRSVLIERFCHTVSILAGSKGCIGGQEPKILYVSCRAGCETGRSESIS